METYSTKLNNIIEIPHKDTCCKIDEVSNRDNIILFFRPSYVPVILRPILGLSNSVYLHRIAIVWFMIIKTKDFFEENIIAYLFYSIHIQEHNSTRELSMYTRKFSRILYDLQMLLLTAAIYYYYCLVHALCYVLNKKRPLRENVMRLMRCFNECWQTTFSA